MRPESACYCRHLVTLETKTRVVLLQHPRERDVAIGTARMAHLCLPRSELHLGVDFSGSAAVARAIGDPSRPAVLLYPGPGGIDITRNPPRGPVTLIVLDGTWWQTKKMLRKNPALMALPRYTIEPPRPSEYRIRREPHAACVSTVEAIVHALGVLEGDPSRYDPLLAAFRVMIDEQIACRDRLREGRVRHMKPRPAVPAAIPACLLDPKADLVCVVGEANSWPYRGKEREAHTDEIVHWVARRLSTGEAFDCVVRPHGPLAPGTCRYTRLSAETLAAGTALEGLFAAWRAFVRDSDVLCSWGRYATRLFVASGGHLPPVRVDLRQVARGVDKCAIGPMEAYGASIGFPSSPPLASGRAGARLGQLAEITRYFLLLRSPTAG